MERWKILTGISAVTAIGIFLLAPTHNIFDLNQNATDSAYIKTTDNPLDRQSVLQKKTPSHQTPSSNALTHTMVNSPDITIASNDDRIRQYSEQFERFFAQSQQLNRDEIRNEILENLLRDSENISLASNTLTNHEYANEHFNDFQAQARVGAIELLRYAAKQGDTTPLKDTLQGLGEVMNTQEKWEKGIQHDYVALIATYVNTIEIEEFLNFPDEHMVTIGLTQKTSVEVQKGLIDSKLRAIEPTILKEKLGHYFQFGES
jgi:hypothetical protein